MSPAACTSPMTRELAGDVQPSCCSRGLLLCCVVDDFHDTKKRGVVRIQDID